MNDSHSHPYMHPAGTIAIAAKDVKACQQRTQLLHSYSNVSKNITLSDTAIFLSKQ